jgi:hypothetical protein
VNNYELYDLDSDPSESVNLFDSQQEISAALAEKLRGWLAETNASLPEPIRR